MADVSGRRARASVAGARVIFAGSVVLLSVAITAQRGGGGNEGSRR
jgi:hypothetical protein